MAYTKYSLTPADNNAAPPNGAPEGMLPSAVNDTMRDMMAQIRDVGDGIRGGTYTMTAPVITGGSITGVALSGNTFTNPVITGGSINNTPIGATTASTGRFSDLTDTGLTSGRVIYAGTGGNLVDDADFTFNGTTVTMANDASISGLTVGKGLGSATSNTAVGLAALATNTSGIANSGFGVQALQLNTTGSGNAAFGGGDLVNYNATLKQNTTGSNNSAFGLGAMGSNTTGGNNTGLGFQALQANTTASNNTAVGYQAGYSNTTGTDITAIGWSAGKANTTGLENTSVGAYSLFSNTTANANTAVGRSALELNTTGATNTAIGHSALKANTTANNNTAVGYQAGHSNTTADGSTFVGYQAGYSSTNTNTAFGRSALYSTTGILNTAFGWYSGNAITTGTKNTIIGSYSGNQGGLDIRTLSNNIVLSDGDGNPKIYHTSAAFYVQSVYDNTTAVSANVCVASNGGISRATSALKYKQDIRDLPSIDINKFRPVVYKSKCENDDQTKDHFGVIADEVDQAGIIELVSYGASGEVEGFQYERLTVVLLKELQTLKADFEAYKASHP